MAKSPADYQVLFVDDLNSMRAIEPGTIAFAPSRDNWNDFGSRIIVEAQIFPLHQSRLTGKRLVFRGFFGFLDSERDSSDTRRLRELLKQNPSPVSAQELPPFFTMLPNMESYRRLVDTLGADEARNALRSMNDMVEADDRPAGKPWLRVAQESEVFIESFLRQSESYFAWKNAQPLLRGVEYEELDRISEGLRIRFRLAGRPNEHDLQFKLSTSDARLPHRLAIVIGKNGVGKSQTLAQIIDAALRGKPHLTDHEGERPAINRILAFYPSASSASVFPSERRKRPKVWYRRFSMTSGRPRQTTSDLIVQLARHVEKIADQTRYEIFLNAIRSIEGHDELALKTTLDEHGTVRISDLTHRGEQAALALYATINTRSEPVRMVEGKTYPLSSGEQSFLRFAAIAALYIENGSLLLFDEPETHLHPNFISQFVALLDELLKQTGSVAILATHSAYFVREVLENQVVVLRSGEDRMIYAERPKLKTFGADVGAISYFVFGENQPSRLAQAFEDDLTAQPTQWAEVFDTYKDRISIDLLGEIRARIDGFNQKGGGD